MTHTSMITPPSLSLSHTHSHTQGHIIWIRPTSFPHPGEPPYLKLRLTVGGSDRTQFVEGDATSLAGYSNFKN